MLKRVQYDVDLFLNSGLIVSWLLSNTEIRKDISK